MRQIRRIQTAVALNEVALWFRSFAFVWCSGQKRPQIEERLHCEDNFYHRWTVFHFIVDYSPWEFFELCIVIPRASLIDRFTSAQWARLMACPHTTNWCKANTRLKIRRTYKYELEESFMNHMHLIAFPSESLHRNDKLSSSWRVTDSWLILETSFNNSYALYIAYRINYSLFYNSCFTYYRVREGEI